MSANILRKTTALQSNQMRLTFGNKKKCDNCEQTTHKQLPELSLDLSIIQIEINNIKYMAKKCVGDREEDKVINEISIQAEEVEIFFCQLCERNFAHKSSWYRHMKEHREAKPTLCLKHYKIDGKYDCFECHKQYTHTRDLKKHLLKAHKKDLEVDNQDNEWKMFSIRKAREFNTVVELEQANDAQYIKKARNLLASELKKIMIKIQYNKIPVLTQIDLDTSLQSYLILEDSFDKKVIKDHQYAYKVYPFNYLLSDDKFQMESTNEYQVLTQAKFKECRYLIQLDAVLLGKDHAAFRLPLFEMTLRDFLTEQRNHKQLAIIATQTIQGIKELQKLCFVHRDLKPENIMINFSPVRVAIIDFNRAQWVEVSRLGSVMGTAGYYPETDDWRDGDFQWDLWAIAAIIECDMPRNDYYSTRCEKDAKQRIQQFIDKTRMYLSMKLMAEEINTKPNTRADISIEQIEQWMSKVSFRPLPHDPKVCFE